MSGQPRREKLLSVHFKSPQIKHVNYLNNKLRTGLEYFLRQSQTFELNTFVNLLIYGHKLFQVDAIFCVFSEKFS